MRAFGDSENAVLTPDSEADKKMFLKGFYACVDFVDASLKDGEEKVDA